MKALISILLLMGSSAFAVTPNSYELKLTVLIDGKVVGTPTMKIQEGTAGNAAMKDSKGQNLFIEASAMTEKVHADFISMMFVVGKILPSGEHEILSTQKVIAKENKQAKIVSTTQGKGSLEIDLLAKRLK